MKRGRVFSLFLFSFMCVISPQLANAAAPTLDLWMDFDAWSSTVGVHRSNTSFGLGGLSYNLQFSESLNLTREYSDYGWVTNDGIFDNSTPLDGSAGSFTNIRFDTVHSPAGTEFAAGTDGLVEYFTINISDHTPRWIYLDIISPSASNGNGTDLVTGLGGSLTVIPDGYHPDAPEPGHTLAIPIIPEPATMLLFSTGWLFALRKHKK